MTADSRVGLRDYIVMAEYIYNRCSGRLAKNICLEEEEISVLIYFVASENKSLGGLFPYPSLSSP